MKKERVRKRGLKGFGRFMLGWFVGFISTILIIVGIGYWAYTSISVGTIEKWTKSNIAGKNEGVRKLTLQDAVGIAMGISKGSDTYTLAKFEEDFGLKLLDDTFMGISLNKLKNAPIKEMKTAFEDTIDSATFNNILSFMDVKDDELGLLKTVLDSEITYYINDGKLCTEENNIESEVEFEYTIEGDVVKFSNGNHTIASNKITPRLTDLPLGTAVESFSGATKDLKISEIMDYHYDVVTDKYYKNCTNGLYSNPVSGVMDAIADYTIEDLSDQSKIDTLKIHEVMGYYYNETDKCYYTTSNFADDTKVAGVMNALAGNTLGKLSEEETFNNLFIYEVMGYTRVKTSVDPDPVTYKYTDKNGDVIGIMATLAGKTVGGLDDKGAFNDILLVDALGYTIDGYKVYESDGETEVTGVVKHLVLKNSTISTIASDVKTLTIGEVLDVAADAPDNSTIINALHDKTVDSLNDEIKKLKLGTILGVEENGPDNSPVVNALWGKTIEELDGAINDLTLGQSLGVAEDEATGVVKTFYHTPITGLADEIQNIKIWQAMGYYEKDDNGNKSYYLNYDETNGYSNPVTGMMATLAPYSVNDLSDSETFNDLHIYEVKGYYKNGDKYYQSYDETNGYSGEVTGIMGMIADSTLGNIQTAIQNIIDTKTINDLIVNGVIEATLTEKTKTVIGGKTITELINFIDDNIDILAPSI